MNNDYEWDFVYIKIQEQIGKMSRTLKAIVTKNSFKERYRTATSYLQKIKALIEDVSIITYLKFFFLI
jgi:hypothetical protein